MVSATLDGAHNGRFVIKPNRSLSTKAARIVFCCCCIVSLAIAGAFATVGFWPILPFAGVELVTLGAAMYICHRDCGVSETVTLAGENVDVEKDSANPPRQWRFQRGWAQVRLQRARVASYPSRLVIRSHGKEVELGRFLTEAERRRLAGQLTTAMRPPTPAGAG